jgi:hypothetical protein
MRIKNGGQSKSTSVYQRRVAGDVNDEDLGELQEIHHIYVLIQKRISYSNERTLYQKKSL